MKKETVGKYRAMTEVELQTELLSLLKEQFNMRMQKSAGQFAKNHLFKKVRRNIARVKTILGEKKAKGEAA